MAYTSDKKPGALNAASTPLTRENQVVLDQNGSVVRARLADVEAKVFDSENKPAQTAPTGTEVVIARQTDGALRQVALNDIVPAGNITNAKISNSAAIVDSKLATIDTAGKVTNQAVQATSALVAGAYSNAVGANRIVTRDGSGNFAAGTITASLSGNAATATSATTATTATTAGTATTATTANKVANTLTRGTYLTGNNFDGSAATTWAVDAATANTVGKVVARDNNGNFSAGTITAALTGNVTGNLTGNAGTVTNGVYTNATQTITGQKSFNAGSASGMATGTGGLNTLEVVGVAGGAAMMTFHRPGAYAFYLGMDTDNQLKVGGWSVGAVAYTLLNSGNYNGYAPTLTGGNASGTWGINITGSAGSAGYATSAGSAGSVSNGSINSASLNGNQTGGAPIYGVRAWVKFDGTGSSGNKGWSGANIFNVYKDGTGDYIINFATALPSASYAISGSIQHALSATRSVNFQVSSQNANGFRILTGYGSTLYNSADIQLMVVG
jgi:hypothetical protein